MSLIRARYRAVNTIMNLPRGGYVGLLDLFPNAAAAYSLRKLRAAYSGSAVRVRKEVSLVSSETDIGFLADGSLDTVSLLAFASDADSGDVFVVTWYDQSLSNDATQSTAANQPKIVSGGSLVTESGKAAVNFDGVDDSLTGAAKTTMNNTAIFTVIKSDSNTQDAVFIQNTLDANNLVALGLGNIGSNNAIGSRLRVGGSTVDSVGDSTFTSTDQTLVSYIADNTAAQMFVDGTEETDAVDSRSGGLDTVIGARGDGNNEFNGAIQEIIFYDSDQSANRTAIETNINTFYSIYP